MKSTTVVMRRARHAISRSLRGKSRRGRPSRADQQRVLERDGGHIAEMLHMRALRQPIDPQFKPYYDRILSGDLRAIADYWDRNASRRDLDASFYELLGRLVTMRSYRAVKQVLSDIERRGAVGWPSERDTFDYWYKEIRPICETARRFIRSERKSESKVNRESLWHKYVLQPLTTVRYLFLVGEADRQLLLHSLNAPIDERFKPYLERILKGDLQAKSDYEEILQKEQNDRDRESRRLAGEELLEWSNSHTESSVRLGLQALGCYGKELNCLSKSSFHLERVNKFRPFSLVTREIFFDLAQTKPVLTPASVARCYACKIVRLSESWASHKTMRKL